MLDSRMDRAIAFALAAHGSQTRKGSSVPYITHPYAVAMMLARAGCGEELIVAGLLHDTMEDCGVTFEQIAREFGPDVARIVAGCSEPERHRPWEERKQHTIDWLREAPLDVKLVACADKLHNVQSMARDQAELGEGLWSRFKRGREQQAWYYRSIVAAFQSEPEAARYPALFGALEDAVAALFGPA